MFSQTLHLAVFSVEVMFLTDFCHVKGAERTFESVQEILLNFFNALQMLMAANNHVPEDNVSGKAQDAICLG